MHVIEEPLSDYMRFELEVYAPNVEAGEDVRLIPVFERHVAERRAAPRLLAL